MPDVGAISVAMPSRDLAQVQDRQAMPELAAGEWDSASVAWARADKLAILDADVGNSWRKYLQARLM